MCKTLIQMCYSNQSTSKNMTLCWQKISRADRRLNKTLVTVLFIVLIKNRRCTKVNMFKILKKIKKKLAIHYIYIWAAKKYKSINIHKRFTIIWRSVGLKTPAFLGPNCKKKKKKVLPSVFSFKRYKANIKYIKNGL